MLLEFCFVCTHKLSVLFTFKVEVKLGDWADVVCHGCVPRFISFNCAENYVGILIFPRKCFKSWFESHAGPAPRSPKVNNYNSIFVQDLLQMSLALNSQNLSKFRIWQLNLLLRCRTWVLHSAPHLLKLLHHLSHVIWVNVWHLWLLWLGTRWLTTLPWLYCIVEDWIWTLHQWLLGLLDHGH